MLQRRGAPLLVCAASLSMACDGSSADAGAGAGGGANLPEPPSAGLGPWACEAGELLLEDGSCLPAGIPPEECGVGFVPTAERACEPLLPSAPCSVGEMALPGETSCRPVAPCAGGTWGDIPVETSTEYVDGSYSGGSDGSATNPWTSVQTAIDNAEDGAIVAVAAGTYTQPLLVQNKRVRLWGACPAMVLIKTTGAPPLRIEAGADGSEVRDLAFESTDAVAVHVGGAVDVLLDRIVVQHSDLIGLDFEDGNPGVTVTRSLVEDQGNIGLFGYGAEIVVEDTVIRGVRMSTSGGYGHGIRVFPDGVPTQLTVRRTMVSSAFSAGIYVRQSSAVIEDSVVTDIQPQAEDPDDGFGIRVVSEPEGPESSLDLSRSYIARVHAAGAYLEAPGNVRTTVVNDVSAPSGSPAAFGIAAGLAEGGTAAIVGVRSSVIARTKLSGIGVVGSIARVEATIVRDIEPSPVPLVPMLPDVGGHGMEIAASAMYPEATLAVMGCRVERTHESGIIATGGQLEVHGTLVSDVAQRVADEHAGYGIVLHRLPDISAPASAVIRDSLVERAYESSIVISNADATIESTWIRDTQPSGPYVTKSGIVRGGRGITIQGYTPMGSLATAIIDRVLVEGSHDSGLVALGADVVLRRSIVRDTRGIDGLYGDGIIAFAMPADLYNTNATEWFPTLLEVSDTIVEKSVRAGISNFWSNVTVSGSWLSCNTIDLNGEEYATVPFDYHDLGGNVCACNGELRSCKVSTSGLQAPVAIDH